MPKLKNPDKSGSLINNLTEGPVLSQLIRFSLPFILANLLQTCYNLADMVIVGHYVGSAGLSAVSISGNVTMLIMNIGTGFTAGGQIVISQLVGANKRDDIKYAAGTLSTTVAIFGILFTVLGVTLATPVLNLMNTPAEAMSEARNYLVICSLGMFFIYGYNNICSILRGMGDSFRPMVFVAVATVLNVALDIIFVGWLGMASAGAALATVISQFAAFIASIIYLYIKRASFIPGFSIKSFIPNRKYLGLTFRLGAPLALMHSSITLSFLFVSSFINAYGLVASAVSGVGGKLNSIMSIITASLQSSGSAMIAQNMGAGKPERVKKLINASLAISLAMFVIVSALSLLFPKQIFGLFNNEPAVLEMAPQYLQIAVITFLSFALMEPFLALINGVGFASLNFIIALLDAVIARIGLSLLLAYTFGMGLQGFWLGSALAGFVSVFLAGGYYYTGRWKTRTLIK